MSSNRKDDHIGQVVMKGHKHARKTDHQKKRAWHSGSSKFNQLLCNIERTFLGQFHSNQDSNTSENSRTTIIKHKSSAKENRNSDIRCQNFKQDEGQTLTSVGITKTHEDQTERNNLQESNEKSKGNDIEFQSEKRHQQQSSKRKMTLNKHQQLIVSSMSSKASVSLSNNKLSIPPPHANNDARRSLSSSLLFATSNLDATSVSSRETRDGTGNQSCANKTQQALISGRYMSPDVASNDATIRRVGTINAGHLHGSTSQANDEKLPNSREKSSSYEHQRKHQQEQKPIRSQLSGTISESGNNNKQPSKISKDEEESAFVTYQSGRALKASTSVTTIASLGHIHPVNKNSFNSAITNSNATTNTTMSNGALRRSLNSVQLQNSTQNLGLMSTIANSTNFQQIACHSNQPLLYHQHSDDVSILGQQHLGDSIKLSMTSVGLSNNLHDNRDAQNVSKPQKTNEQAMSQQRQFFSQYYQSQAPIGLAADQQIYANAPPKPRRYQYYDAGLAHHPPSHMFVVSPQMQPPVSVSVSVSGPCNSITQFQQEQIPQANQMVQLRWLSNQPTSNYTQQPIDSPSATITKSRSSLDNRFQPNPAHQVHLQVPTYSYNGDNNNSPLQFGAPTNIRPQLLNPTSRWLQPQMPLPRAQMQFDTRSLEPGNLIRSKSVSHLVPEVHAETQTCGPELRVRSLFDSKFSAASSVSTTDLNFHGLQPTTIQIRPIMQPLDVFNESKMANQQSLAIQQMKSYSNIKQQQQQEIAVANNEQHLLQPSALLWQQSQFHQEARKNSPLRQIQQNQQSGIKQNIVPSLQNYHDNKENNQANRVQPSSYSARPTSQQRGLRNQRQTTSASSARQSLDDKIKSLMLSSNDHCELPAAGANRQEHTQPFDNTNLSRLVNIRQSNRSHINANFAIEESVEQKYDQSLVTDLQTNPRCVLSGTISENRNHVPIAQTTSTARQTGPVELAVGKTSQLSHQDHEQQTQLTNSIYVSTGQPQMQQHHSGILRTMGNSGSQQYHVNVDQGAIRSTLSCADMHTQGGNIWRQPSESNSRLIVDLTTPRVLAKTQTRLQPNQRHDAAVFGHQQMQTQTPMTRGILGSRQDACSSTEIAAYMRLQQEHDQFVLKRTAPYYYSDLKSDEQRKALLEIVQQKSLSPPPQLLSRSTDQSSTRLAMRPPISSLSLIDSNQLAMQQRMHQNQQNAIRPILDTASNNLNKNIERLFDVNDKLSGYQSMLTLNATTAPVNCLSASLTTSESLSSGYCSSEPNSKSMSKSKSLDNINKLSGISSENGSTNPVYENICRSSKLMNALDGSKTKIETVKQPNYLDASSYPADLPKSSMMTTISSPRADESIDSIFGSSLDDSDSSLDIGDGFAISPSEHSHLSNMTKLMEQLKINNSKLSEEYRSTLARIQKIMQKRNDKKSEPEIQEKLCKRLEVLEAKSKRCESRSKNHLALIVILEKVLKQSEQRSSTASFSSSSSKRLQFDNANKLLDESDLDCTLTDPSVSTSNTSPSDIKSSKGNGNLKNETGSRVVRAIVRESHSREPEVETAEIVSTPNQENHESKANPFDNKKQRASLVASEITLDLLRDDDDFIEFLSSNGTNHRSCQFEASQFEASQFNASNFGNLSSSEQQLMVDGGREPKSRQKVKQTEQKCRPQATSSSAASLTGILKRARPDANSEFSHDGHEALECTHKETNIHDNDDNLGNHNSNNASSGTSNSSSNDCHDNDPAPSADGAKSELESILGNVIDVDVYSLKYSSGSPALASRQAECFN